MGLLKILRKLKRKAKEMRILVLGLDNAGKTTFVKRLCGEVLLFFFFVLSLSFECLCKDVSGVSPTVGFNICALEHGPFRLTLWDVGGQRSLRAFWRNYFEETDGLIWVVDSADESRLQESRDELASLGVSFLFCRF